MHRKALAIKPKDHDHLYNIASLAAIRGDGELAISRLEQWRDKDPQANKAKLDNDPSFDLIRRDQLFVSFWERLPEQAKPSAGLQP
jgi:hypothetical protein